MPHSPLGQGTEYRGMEQHGRRQHQGYSSTASPLPCPTWMAQKAGHFINVSSVAGHKVKGRNGTPSTPPPSTPCAPSSEGLHQEVKPYNIRTTVVYAGRGCDGAARQRRRGRHRLPKGRDARVLRTSTPCRRTASPGGCVFAIGQPEDVDINEVLYSSDASDAVDRPFAYPRSPRRGK